MGSLVLLIITLTVFDKRLHIPWQKLPGGNLKAILWGLGGWIVLLIASVVVLRFISPAHANISAVIGLMGATTPALATSKIANLITFGVAIAFVETVLWSRIMEFFADVFNININKRSLKTFALLFLITILALVFVFFHLTAKGVTNTPALVIVFVMMVVSLVMVSYFEEIRAAAYMHIWANTIASYLMLYTIGALSI